jgi:hypothetical protein
VPTEFGIGMRRGLLDALVLVGAQAIAFHTDESHEPISIETKDSDLVVDPAKLRSEPLLEDALAAAHFKPNVVTGQPGEWLSPEGTPVDLLVPAGVAPGNPRRRGVDLAPHARRATRRTSGLEAALVDHAPQTIGALEPGDDRAYTVAVAGPAALLIAKLQKITDRQTQSQRRQVAKDGHDVYRLLRDVPTATITDSFARLLAIEVSRASAVAAIEQLQALFGASHAPGVDLAAKHLAGAGDPLAVAEAVVVLAHDLLDALLRSTNGGPST